MILRFKSNSTITAVVTRLQAHINIDILTRRIDLI